MPRYWPAILCILLLPLWSVPSPAQTDARDVLDNAIQKLGGEAYLNVTDIRATGRLFQFQRNEIAGVETFVDYIQIPDKERTEFGKDGKIVRINNGTRGWNVNDGKVEEQIPEQIELFWQELKVSLDYLLRHVVDDRGSSLQYLGREMVDFKRVDVLEIRDDDRTRINLYIDRSNGLLLKKTVRRLNDPAVYEEIYSNYHEIQGILTPLLVHRYKDGVKTMEIRFDEVRYNEAPPAGFFEDPDSR